jgi:hypothetical protein
MTMTFHVKQFEKKVFEEVFFLLKYHQKPPSTQETKHRKRERESIEKKKKTKKDKGKRGRKKTPRVSSNKGEVNILRGEKHFNFKNIFFFFM